MRKNALFILAFLIACLWLLPTDAAAAEEGYYTYTVANGEATITKCKKATGEKVLIPSTLGGYPVTCIGKHAFVHQSMYSLVIPDSVKTIESNAFYGNASLMEITIPKSVTNIGTDAFAHCDLLMRYILDADNPYYSCDETGILYNRDKTVLISMPAGRDFNGSYTIPDSVTTIGDYAFGESLGLTSITVPKSVTSIGKGAFFRCESLTHFFVDETNEYFSSNDEGVLFNKDKSTLIAMPGDVEGLYTIPDSVITIGDYAFASCRLEGVFIPDSVVRIDDHAFYECRINSITIPNSVTSIGENAFYNCVHLKRIAVSNSNTSIGNFAFDSCFGLEFIYYSGNESEWANLVTNRQNTDLSNVTIRYNTTITPANCEHSYSRHFQISDAQHTQVCTLCATEKNSDHVWDNGVVVRSESYIRNGITTYTCTQCLAEKNVNVTKKIDELFLNVVIAMIALIVASVFIWRVKKLH